MKVLNFIIIKFTIGFIIGVFIGHLYNISLITSLIGTCCIILLLLIFYVIAKRQFIKTVWFGISSFISIIFIGILVINFHNEKNLKNHYTQQLLNKNNSLKTITFKVREVLKPGNYYDKYIVDLFELDNKLVLGKTLLNIKKDTLKTPLKVDNVFISKLLFKDLIPPLNPEQFDYKSYLEKNYIYHQLFTTKQSLFKIKQNNFTLLGIANKVREFINKKLNSYHFKPDELAIINALILGQRQDISKDIYTNYTNAGAIHILAISGLHVGIFLLLLEFIFKLIKYFKHGKLIKAILIIIILWSFALVTGLSASVTRAVTMFSIITIANHLKRPTNIFNTLAISILVILLFKPMFLFDVGFQLSYLAVFAIVIVDPLLYKLWAPKNWLINKLWHTFTVTMSAQLGIIPISLYYFHQFPGLFFISNLVIIPVLGIILGLGILIIVLSILNILPQFLANIYGSIINLLNTFIEWVSLQDSFLFKNIPFSFLYTIVSYIFIIMFVRLYIKRNYTSLKLFLLSILLIQASIFYTDSQKKSNEFIVFHKSRFSLLGNITNNKITVASNFDSITKLKSKIITDYTVGNHIKSIQEDSLQSLYLINNKKILIIDSLGIYNIKLFKPDYVLLRQSPKINLNRLIDSIHPKYIIADGSNYKSYIKDWETICKKQKLPFHQTSKKGAFIIKY